MCKKGGSMKQSIVLRNLVVLLFIVSGMLVARSAEPVTTLAAYNNKISKILHSVGSHDKHAITFVCQKDPICIYTPLSFQDINKRSVTKTYFLPRTECTDSQLRFFYQDLRHAFAGLGVDLQISELKNANYGLRVSFSMQSDHLYDIAKVVNAQSNTVSFTLSPL